MSQATAKAKKTEPKQAVIAEKKQKRKEQPKILVPSRFQIAEYSRQVFNANIPVDHDFEDVLKPGYWVNQLPKVAQNPTTREPDRTGSLIYVGSEDHAFFGILYIRAVYPQGMVVSCIGPGINLETGEPCAIDLATQKPWSGRKNSAYSKYKPSWNNHKGGFDIVRLSDNQIVADGTTLKTIERAHDWIYKIENEIPALVS